MQLNLPNFIEKSILSSIQVFLRMFLLNTFMTKIIFKRFLTVNALH
jgi:hypothetical protein